MLGKINLVVIANKCDHLWIRWVSHIYIKRLDWFHYIPSVNTSWTWRKLCQVKEQLKYGYSNGTWQTNHSEYTVSQGYKWLTGPQTKVAWWPLIWSRVNYPKHSFIGWLAIQDKLLTKDRLLKFGVLQDEKCELCLDHIKDHQHLLYTCPFSAKCLVIFKSCLGVPFPTAEVLDWIVKCRCKSLMKKKIIFTAMLALVYHIWTARNICRLECRVQRPERIIEMVK
ncbi:uncharacterized protein LOC141613800 [Silene latifolia]|uniref:uncharacterized protein LOC141613800 n=1 Tax=Silene latifolia TaxID=37657 RepID=UPI003D77F824